jgi:hypothetical protein
MTLYPSPQVARRALPPVRHVAAGGARALAAVLIALVATAAGIGWLYTLRRVGVLAAGPGLREALPLQRLAGGSTQPLLRLIAAWLPAGLAAGVALRLVGLGRRVTRAAWAFPASAALLLALGAAADAVTANEPLRAHLAAQPTRAATWLAAALFGIGAALPRARRR